MRILSVTQSYAPFYEFGGSRESGGAGQRIDGARARSDGSNGGLGVRIAGGVRKKSGRCEALSVRMDERSKRRAERIFADVVPLPGGHLESCDRQIRQLRLSDFDVVHIFGLYDLLGPAVAHQCRKQKIPYLIEPIGMFVPIVRNISEACISCEVGKEMLGGAAVLIATAEQEVEELPRAEFRRKIVLRRNGVVRRNNCRSVKNFAVNMAFRHGRC